MSTKEEIQQINSDIDNITIQINVILKLIKYVSICFLLGLIVGFLL